VGMFVHMRDKVKGEWRKLHSEAILTEVFVVLLSPSRQIPG
jgi:hypothetical protein